MDLLQPNTGGLPPALRALALGLLVETAVPLRNKTLQEENPVPPGQGEGNTEHEAVSWETLRGKCRELSNLVLLTADPGEAAAYVLAYLPRHIEDVLELVHCQKRPPVPPGQQRGRLADRA